MHSPAGRRGLERVCKRETDISAFQYFAKEKARFQGTNGDQERTCYPAAPAPARASQAGRLSSMGVAGLFSGCRPVKMICAEAETQSDASRASGEAREHRDDRKESQRPLSKDHRLRTRRQLAYVRKRGASRAGKRCVAYAAEPQDGQARVVIVISRRYSRKAVTRNRARRLLREAYRRLFPELAPAWIMLIPRRRMEGARLQDVLAELKRLFAELRLLPDTRRDRRETAE